MKQVLNMHHIYSQIDLKFTNHSNIMHTTQLCNTWAKTFVLYSEQDTLQNENRDQLHN